MRVYACIVLFLMTFSQVVSQSDDDVRKLQNEYSKKKGSKEAINILIELSEKIYAKDRLRSEEIAKKAVSEARLFKNESCFALAMLRLTNVYFENGKYEQSYFLADTLLDLAKKLKDNHIYADACKIIGRRYHFRGEYDKALEYYLKGLQYFEKENNQAAISEIYNSIGGVYLNQEDNKNAYKYYHKAQTYAFILKNTKGIGRGYLNMANVLIVTKEFSKAKMFLDSASFYYNLIGSEEGIAYVYSTYSEIYIAAGKPDSALYKLLEARQVIKSLNKLYTLSQTNLGIAALYVEKKDYVNALKYIDEGIETAKKTNQSHNLMPLLLMKSQVLETTGKVNEAFKNYKLYKQYSDSVINAKTIRKQTEDALTYDYNKREYQRELEKQKELAAQQEKETQQRFLFNAILGGLVLLMLILFLVIRSYRIKQKSNKIIAEQKAEVEKQHHLLQEKNREVLDSIQYSKRLQEAILPSLEVVKKQLPESFVLYKPKDIVAGDFYWMETIKKDNDELILLAAADCTGHGVPGALVSVVCSNALDRAVLEFGLTEPAAILNKTRELVIATFEKSDKEVKDGMDISLASIHKNNAGAEIKWSGANNPLWIISQAGDFNEIKADKQPIGKYDVQSPFKQHQLKLNKGDKLFLFTDGFADQFGGEKGKKFKYKQMIETLVQAKDMEMEKCMEHLYNVFVSWKGNLEQVDDVCVIGVKV